MNKASTQPLAQVRILGTMPWLVLGTYREGSLCQGNKISIAISPLAKQAGLYFCCFIDMGKKKKSKFKLLRNLAPSTLHHLFQYSAKEVATSTALFLQTDANISASWAAQIAVWDQGQAKVYDFCSFQPALLSPLAELGTFHLKYIQ